MAEAKELRAPFDLVQEVAAAGRLPVVLFTAGGIATPADAALMMQLGADGVFVGSGIFKSGDPVARARAIVEATTYFGDPDIIAKVSHGLPGRRWWGSTWRTSPHRNGWRREAGSSVLKVGVLGLQGDVREHVRAIEAAGATAAVVRAPDELAATDAMVIPGGESTTIGKLLDRFGLLQPLSDRIAAGMPAYGTCAGLILMAREVTGSQDAPHRIGGLDVVVRRNGYGRQIDSFESDVAVEGLEEPLRAVFIRAPVIEAIGAGVEVLATVDGNPVLVRQGRSLASSFHPEMTGDPRIHEMFLELATAGGGA